MDDEETRRRFGTAPPEAGAAGEVEVLLMRHAEKTGDRADRGLSPAGERRARRLADTLPTIFGPAHVLIAAADTPLSARPRLTLEPVAARLGRAILTDWRTDEVGPLAAAILRQPRFAGRRILLSWRHEALPDLARALGAPAPPDWPSCLYGVVWRIARRGGRVEFEIRTDGIGPEGSA